MSRRSVHTPPIVEPNRWYLAYGSNLSAKTFRGRRGIRPLAQTNVIVPSLELTFDLPGIPYWEPCFANVRWREDSNPSTVKSRPAVIGTAYLVTPKDWARIMATEGGGLSYKEVVVECRRIPGSHEATSGDDNFIGEAKSSVEADEGEIILASTLLAPDSKRRSTPMQPSARYINIIRTGARGKSAYSSHVFDIPPYSLMRAHLRLPQKTTYLLPTLLIWMASPTIIARVSDNTLALTCSSWCGRPFCSL